MMRRGLIVCVMLPCTLSVRVGNECGAEEPDARVKRVVDQTLQEAAREPARRMDVSDRLAILPRDEVLESLVGAIEGNEAFRESGARLWAYGQLVLLGGLQSERVFALLEAGMADAEMRDFCVRQLVAAPPEFQDRAYPLVHEFMQGADRAAERGGSLHGLVRAIGERGPAGARYVPDVVEVLRDPRTGKNLRGVAAESLLDNVGLMEALKCFRELDGGGQAAAMGPIIKYLGSEEYRFLWHYSQEDYPAIMETRQFVVEATAHPDMAVRDAALTALAYVYGKDVVVQDANGGYSWEPVFAAAMEAMIANDPDPELRTRANGIYTMHEPAEIAKRIARRAARAAKAAAEEGAGDPGGK